jgi:hypothetical protein
VDSIAPGRRLTHVSGELYGETLTLFAKCSSPIRAFQIHLDMGARDLENLPSLFPDLELVSSIDYDKLSARRFFSFVWLCLLTSGRSLGANFSLKSYSAFQEPSSHSSFSNSQKA